MGDLPFPFTSVFNHLFLSTCTHRCFLYSELESNTNLLYWSICSIFSPWELFRMVPMPLRLTSLHFTCVMLYVYSTYLTSLCSAQGAPDSSCISASLVLETGIQEAMVHSVGR